LTWILSVRVASSISVPAGKCGHNDTSSTPINARNALPSLLHSPSSASPSLREGRRRGFASRRGGALRERGEKRKVRGERKRRRGEEEESGRGKEAPVDAYQ
jgi:hypothetical protein